VDAGRSYTYMLKQPGGAGKLVIAGLLLFIPLLGWAIVAGYMVRTLRDVAHGREELPAWDDFGQYLVNGLLIWVGLLIYSLPGTILQTLDGIGGLLGFVWSLAVFVVFPAAATRFAVNGDFGAFFQFNDIWSYIQNNMNNYIMAVVLALVAGILAGFGVILFIIGVVFTIAWSMLVTAHLYGSVWAQQARTPSFSAGPPSAPPDDRM
jgi:hypothetical protein